MRKEGYRSVQIRKSALAALESTARGSALGKCSGDNALIECLVSTGTMRNASTFPLPCQSVTS